MALPDQTEPLPAADAGSDTNDAYVVPQWYACYTRARAEKQVEKALRDRNFESYLPLITRERQWKDRKKLVSFPLFPSYVFGHFALRDMHAVLSTPGISTIVRINGGPARIPAEELDNVRRFVDAIGRTGLEPELRPLLEEGQRVRVTEGAFEGIEGIVIEARGQKRVLVGITAIGQGLEIDIDVRLLKPLRG